MSGTARDRARVKREAAQRLLPHRFVDDQIDKISCARCNLPRTNARHGGCDVRVTARRRGVRDGAVTLATFMVDEELIADGGVDPEPGA